MIMFQKIRWKNLLSTGNLFTEIDLNSNKTTLIVGENGSGKSTILDAISFCLFNKPFRKINKPQLLNTITNKELVVEVEFTINRDSYKVIRGIKPTVFEIYVNDVMLNQDAASKDYQEFFEKNILKMNHKSFCQVVVLGSASYVPFMQLPAGQRRELIEDLLDLDIFTVMNSRLKEKVSINNSDIVSVLNEKKVAETKIELMNEHISSMAESNELVIEEKNSIIDDTNRKIKEANERKTILMGLRDLQNELLKGKKVAEKKRTKITQYMAEFNAKIKAAKETASFFSDHDTCPTCTQGIDTDLKNHVHTEKTAVIDKFTDAIKTLKEEQVNNDKELKKFDKIESELRDVILEMSQLNTKITTWLEYISSLEKDISKLDKEKKDIDMSKIADIEAYIVELEKTYTELSDNKNVLAAASHILKDTGIKSKIIKQFVPIINRLINKYLSDMGFFIQFELNEQFEETIKSWSRDDFSYTSFSEGEKMRINLAVLFTWRAVSKQRNSVSTNLLIMDEVFDSSLDNEGTEEFLKILNNLTADTSTFIISHRTGQLYDKFEKIITFSKTNNFSKIV